MLQNLVSFFFLVCGIISIIVLIAPGFRRTKIWGLVGAALTISYLCVGENQCYLIPGYLVTIAFFFMFYGR